MNGIKLLITIVPRGLGEEVVELCRKSGITFSLIAPGKGAAGSHFIDLFGLSNPEKDCVFSVVQAPFCHDMMERLNGAFRMNEPNTGICLSIPIAGVSGPRALRYISGIYPPPDFSALADMITRSMQTHPTADLERSGNTFDTGAHQNDARPEKDAEEMGEAKEKCKTEEQQK